MAAHLSTAIPSLQGLHSGTKDHKSRLASINLVLECIHPSREWEAVRKYHVGEELVMLHSASDCA